MKKTYLFACILTAALMAASCAIDNGETSDSFYDTEMKAWINIYYPSKASETTSDGAYILEYQKGAGEDVIDTGYVFAHYCKKDLEGNIVSTNIQSLAEQLGTFSQANSYGSRIWKLGQNSVCPPVEEVLKTMKVGGHARLAVPVAASVVSNVQYDAFESNESFNVVIDVYVDRVERDIFEVQKAELKEYAKRYPAMDTITDSYYFTKLKRTSGIIDSIHNEKSINVRYIGRLLNGHVFDTNIADTAKKYRLYSADNSYSALSITYYDEFADMKEKNSSIEGFLRALHTMQPGEEAVTFFDSTLGYGAAGSGEGIPEYTPLCFYLYVEEQ